MIIELTHPVVCVVGLGYVGLPLARAFARELKVIGLDIDPVKLENLRRGELSSLPNLQLTTDPASIKNADFVIICVPTPVTKSKIPDLSPVISAASTVSENLKPGSVVILESTVYPGVTEEVVAPILERSGLKCGADFKIGYSPERINPGDPTHTVDKVTKVVSGIDEETTEAMVVLYGKAAPNIFRARNIRTAEAAKVIENIQRDINIALVNELAALFATMGIDIQDVLDAAATKWNFNRYSPGLVGGHCIPVDPYYLVWKANELGFHPRLIVAGRAVNDNMPKYVVDLTSRALNSASKAMKGSTVLMMGLTYKENVADTRESPAKAIIEELIEYEAKIIAFDPILPREDFGQHFRHVHLISSLRELDGTRVDAIIVSVAHSAFRNLKLADFMPWLNPYPALIDVRRVFDGTQAKKLGFIYKTL